MNLAQWCYNWTDGGMGWISLDEVRYRPEHLTMVIILNTGLKIAIVIFLVLQLN